MTPVYSPIGSAPACPRSYAAEVASLETPLRVGTSCHLQLLHVLAIGVPRKRTSSSGFLKTRRTRLPRSGLVLCLLCAQRHNRHTCATHLLRGGVDINTIRGWLGHVSVDTTNIYAELDLDAKAKALAKCAVDEQNKPIRRWRDQPDLLEFLRAL